jgi:methionine-S-sulfoxide reductase
MPGVIRTRVGYTGGTKKNPSYRSLGDHTEAVQIDFDPARIAYEDLLEVFWSSHDPRSRSRCRQYMAAVFFHDGAQKKLAEKTRDRAAERLGGRIFTKVLPAARFHLAEDYHQKYMLRRNRPLVDEFERMYPGGRGFTHSTAAARINGFLGGNGEAEILKKELDLYGLSESGRRRVAKLFSRLD